MSSHTSLVIDASRKMIYLCLMVLLAACGGGTDPKSALTPSSANNNTVHVIAFDAHHLHIYSQAGIQCFGYYYSASLDKNLYSVGGNLYAAGDGSVIPHGNLVLATQRLKYDIEELHQMKSYVSNYQAGELALPTLPSTLSWLSGGLQCSLAMELTNSGNTPVKLQTMDLRLMKTPQENNRQYRLIDYCTLLAITGACPGEAGGGGPLYNFQLSMGKVGKVFFPQVQSTTGAAEQVLQPYDTLFINASIISAQLLNGQPSSPSNLIYSVLPELVMDIQGKQQVIPLSPLASTLYFVKPNQLFCYLLQGNTFVLDTIYPEQSGCI